MSSQSAHLDGNAAAGELSRVFAIDLTAAEVQCGNCEAVRRFAEAHLYMNGPGIVARCCDCGHVVLRLVSTRQRVLLDLGGMTWFKLDMADQIGFDDRSA